MNISTKERKLNIYRYIGNGNFILMIKGRFNADRSVLIDADFVSKISDKGLVRLDRHTGTPNIKGKTLASFIIGSVDKRDRITHLNGDFNDFRLDNLKRVSRREWREDKDKFLFEQKRKKLSENYVI